MDIAAFLTQTVNVDNVTIKFEIWDTAGQGRLVFFSVITLQSAIEVLLLCTTVAPLLLLSCTILRAA